MAPGDPRNADPCVRRRPARRWPSLRTTLRVPLTAAGLALVVALAAGGGERSGPLDARPAAKVVGGAGYWLVGSDGGVFAFGDAGFHGSTGGLTLNRPVVGMAATPSGRGYWLVGSDGGVFAFGDARFHGSGANAGRTAPAVALVATATGRGYWLVGADGAVTAFGDAPARGSLQGVGLNSPIVTAAATPSGQGYWLAARDGGVFAFGDAGFHGSAGSVPRTRPAVTLSPSATGKGYWVAGDDGGVFSYGDAGFFGSTGNLALNRPVVGMAASPRVTLDAVPDAAADAASVLEDQAVTVPVLANDADLTDGGVQVTVATGPAKGTAAVLPGGSVRYTPAADATGADTFTYRVTDDDGDSDTASVAVAIVPVNDAPGFALPAAPDQTVVEDSGPQSVPGFATSITAGPPDEAGQVLSFSVTTTNPALFQSGPTVNASTGALTYRTAADAFGTATVTVRLHDGGGTANGGVDTSAPRTFTITVQDANEAPVAAADAFGLTEGGALSVAAPGVLGNDTDTDGPAPLTAVAGTAPTSAASFALAADGSFSYTPSADFSGTDTFTYRARDGAGAESGAIVATITVAGVNDAPSFTKGGDRTVPEDAGAQTVPGWATAISAGPASEAGQALTFTVSNDDNALFSAQPAVAADGTLTFTPAPDASGSATVTISVSDDGGTANGGVDTSGAQSFTITVTPVNDAPSFTRGADVTVPEDASAQAIAGWATAIAKGPADESGQTVSFTATNGNNALFSAQPAVAANGTLSFTPAADANGSATVTVSVSDSGGTANGGDDTSDGQTFTITVTAVNDAPSFTKGADQVVVVDSGAQTVGGWATAISRGPANEAGQALTFSVANGNNALFSAQPDVDESTGDLTYTPAAGATGSATVSVSLSDSGGTANGGVDTSAPQTFTITVIPPNAVPTADATSASGNEDGGAIVVTLTGHDADGDALTFDVGTATNGLVTVPGAVNCAGTPSTCTTTVNYTPNADFFGSDSFTYRVNDGLVDSAPATASITVNPVNDAPSFTKGADQTVLEEASTQTVAGWAGAVAKGPANESGQTLSFGVTNDNNGLFSVQPAVSPTGTLTYTPASNANGSATVTVTLSDDGGTANGGVDTSAGQTFTITVTAVNDAPSFTKGADRTLDEDAGAQSVAGWATAISKGPADESAQTLTFAVTNDDNALFSAQPAVSATGTLTFTPAPNAHGSATVTVTLSDNGGTANGGDDTGDAQTFTITVNAVNDAPTAVAKAYTAQANMKISLGGLLVGAADANDTAANPGYTPTFTVGTITVGAGCVGCTVSNVNSANGTFDFDPPAGGSGTYTLDYTVVDTGDPGPGATSASQTITMTVNGPVVWFVDTAAAPGGTGRLSAPFTTLAGAAAVDAANHRIFVAPGTYTDGITLLSGEWLAGSGAEATDFDTLMGITPPAGTIARPAVNTTAPTIQGAVTLASNNTVRGVTLTGAPALTGSSFGTLTLGAGANADVALSSAGQALSLTTGTVSGDFLSTSSSGGANNVLLSSVSSTGTSLGSGALSAASSEGFRVTGGTGTFSYAGTVANATGTTVSVANKTGGTVTLSGAVSDTAGAGVALTTNTGATINFTGGVNLTSGTSPAFAATGGGTVSVTGSANTLSSTTGTALNITGTTIGAADVTFRSISSNGASKGIVLDTTGALGNLVVTGNGGTCTAANTSGCSGGTIANSAGADDSSTSPVGTGIVLNSTRDVSLTRMFVNGSTNYGIRGNAVTNLSLVDSVIGGTNGTNVASPFNDGSAMFTELTGTVAFTRVEVSGGFGSNVEITNTSGTLSSTFDAVRIGTNGNDGLQVEGTGTATVNATIQNSFFTSAPGDLVQYIGDGSGGGNLTMTGNTLTNDHPAIATGGGGVSLSGGANGIVTMNISGNTSRDAVGHAWLIVKSLGSGSMTGTFDGNTVGVAGTADSGSLEGDGLKLQHAGTGTMSWTVTNNAIRQYNNQGIHLQAGAGVVAGGTFSITNLSGNTVANPGTNPAIGLPSQGIHLNSGVTPGDSFTSCVNFGANTITGSGRNGGTDFRVRQRQSTTVRLPGYGGAAGDTAAVVAFVQGKLVTAASGSAAVDFPTTGGGFVGTAC